MYVLLWKNYKIHHIQYQVKILRCRIYHILFVCMQTCVCVCVCVPMCFCHVQSFLFYSETKYKIHYPSLFGGMRI